MKYQTVVGPFGVYAVRIMGGVGGGVAKYGGYRTVRIFECTEEAQKKMALRGLQGYVYRVDERYSGVHMVLCSSNIHADSMRGKVRLGETFDRYVALAERWAEEGRREDQGAQAEYGEGP